MGLIYALIAIEYTLIYNSCALLNFAHGQLVMFGAYIFAGTMVTSLGMSLCRRLDWNYHFIRNYWCCVSTLSIYPAKGCW